MAVAQTPTLLSLDRFATVLGLHPLHFNQVDANIGSAQSRVCIEPIFQYSWQHSDAISREELALAIMEAEEDISRELGYTPAVEWHVAERVELEHPVTGWFASGFDVRGDRIACKAKYGHVISGGWKAKILIDDAAGIVYTDIDSDTYFETATVSVATTVTNPDEIAVYYPGQSGSDEWEIRPITVSISGGIATIVFRRDQAVVAIELSKLDASTLNGLTDGNFLSSVDVYRKYNDPNKQVEFVWRNTETCSCSGSCECSLTVQNGCMTVKDAELGVVTLAPGEWNDDTGGYDPECFSVCRRPDYVRLWYRAGKRDLALTNPNINMARRWELAIAKLAVTKLDRNICSCKAIIDMQTKWTNDLRRSRSTSAESISYRVSSYELENNPFGSTIAAQDVWRLVRREMLGV